MTIADNDIFRITPQEHRRNVDGGYVVLDREGDQFHYLNGTGAFVLDHCDGRHTVEDIAERMQAMYGLDATPSEDVRECIGDLLAKKLIERAPIFARLRRWVMAPGPG